MLRRRLSITAAPSAALTSLRFRHGRTSAEEQAELDREAKLRQDFARKQMADVQKNPFSRFMMPGFTGSRTAAANMSPEEQQQARARFGSLLYASLLYSLAFYLLIITWEMRKPQSVAMTFQGVAQVAVPTEVLVTYLAIRILLPSTQQRQIQNDFEQHRLTNPNHNIYHYVMLCHPNLFAGRTTSQRDFIGAMMAAHIASPDHKWTKSIRNVSRFSDAQARIDSAMDNLRRDFPQAVRATA